MKRFKFWIVSVLVLLSWIISIWYCDNIYNFSSAYFSLWSSDIQDNPFTVYNFTSWTCLVKDNYLSYLSFYNNNWDFIWTWINWNSTQLFCLDFDWYVISNYNKVRSYYYFSWLNNLSNLSCQECPEIDTNYCVENDLCPVPSNFSQLFINDIEHESAPLINVSIPEEFEWDSSIDSWQFNLDVVGYNVDTEYIDWIIRTQKTTPNSTDFNNIVSVLFPLLVPGLVIILFIYFIFRFIKKVF